MARTLYRNARWSFPSAPCGECRSLASHVPADHRVQFRSMVQERPPGTLVNRRINTGYATFPIYSMFRPSDTNYSSTDPTLSQTTIGHTQGDRTKLETIAEENVVKNGESMSHGCTGEKKGVGIKGDTHKSNSNPRSGSIFYESMAKRDERKNEPVGFTSKRSTHVALLATH